MELLQLKDIISDMTEDQIWRHRSKEPKATPGAMVVARHKYQVNEWVQFGGRDGRGAWELRWHHRQLYGVVISEEHIINEDGKKYKNEFEWHVIEITPEQYEKAKKAKEKADKKRADEEYRKAQERQLLALKKEEERRLEEDRKRKEKEEAVHKEEERRAQPLSMTVGEFEDLISELRSDLYSEISDLREKVNYIDDHYEFRPDPMDE